MSFELCGEYIPSFSSFKLKKKGSECKHVVSCRQVNCIKKANMFLKKKVGFLIIFPVTYPYQDAFQAPVLAFKTQSVFLLQNHQVFSLQKCKYAENQTIWEKSQHFSN